MLVMVSGEPHQQQFPLIVGSFLGGSKLSLLVGQSVRRARQRDTSDHLDDAYVGFRNDSCQLLYSLRSCAGPRPFHQIVRHSMNKRQSQLLKNSASTSYTRKRPTGASLGFCMSLRLCCKSLEPIGGDDSHHHLLSLLSWSLNVRGMSMQVVCHSVHLLATR